MRFVTLLLISIAIVFLSVALAELILTFQPWSVS